MKPTKPVKDFDHLENRTSYLPSMRTALLVIALIGIASFVSYRAGRASMNPVIEACNRNTAAWKMIRKSDQALSEIKIAARKNLSVQDFESRFGELEPLTSSQLPENITDKTHRFVDPESKRVFYLKFSDEGLTGYKSAYDLTQAIEAIDELSFQQASW